MTIAKDALRLAKKLTRKERNKAGKVAKAAAREAASKIPHIDVPPVPKSVPALAWQNGKSLFRNSGISAKHRPGNSQLHEAAEAENHARSLTAYQPGLENDGAEPISLTDEQVAELAEVAGAVEYPA